MPSNILAVDIGGTHFRVALFDQNGQLLEATQSGTSHEGGQDWMLAQLREHAGKLLGASRDTVKACGISFGGPVDYASQRVTSVHTPGWRNFPLTSWVRDTFGIPALLDNDANVGALGEYRFGAGQGVDSLIYITLSTGIGSGLVINGKVFRGRDSMAGEIGHLPLSDLPVACTCGGSGCLESLSSGRSIARFARELAATNPQASARMLGLSGGRVEDLTAHRVFEAAAEGDPAARQLLRDAIYWLARALTMAIRLINPDKIILGGGVAQAGDRLLIPLRELMAQWKSENFPYTTEICAAGLGNDSPLYGAAALGLALLGSSSG
ncbi:MAG: ROK family protein [Terriglobia bacterium]